MVFLSRRLRAGMLVVAILGFGAVSNAEAEFMFTDDYFSCPSGRVYSGTGDYVLHCVWDGKSQGLAFAYEGPGPDQTLWRSWTDANSNGLGTHVNQWWPPLLAYGDAVVVMQGDGNLVLYNSARTAAAWSTNTANNSGAYLNVQDDGNLVVYSSSNTPLWSRF